jgi:hypothetical protein
LELVAVPRSRPPYDLLRDHPAARSVAPDVTVEEKTTHSDSRQTTEEETIAEPLVFLNTYPIKGGKPGEDEQMFQQVLEPSKEIVKRVRERRQS